MKPKVLVAIQACHRLPALKAALRETWMGEWRDLADIFMFVGHWQAPVSFYAGEGRRPSGRNNERIAVEPPDFPDEVWVDASDWKQHLSEKVVKIVEWALEQGYDFCFKADMDTYVHVPRLLASGFEKYDYIGHPIRRTSEYMLPWRGRDVTYAQGGAGFWLSRRAMRAFVDADQDSIPYQDAEDIRMGWLLAEADIPLQEDMRYEPYQSTMRAPAPGNGMISTHKCNAEQMRRIHAKFGNNSTDKFVVPSAPVGLRPGA